MFMGNILSVALLFLFIGTILKIVTLAQDKPKDLLTQIKL